MMNSIETQAIPTISAPIPSIEAPHIPLDPTNPLAWILVIAVLLRNTDKIINAIANLIRAVASFNHHDDKRDDHNS